jgi:hypothetical protein
MSAGSVKSKPRYPCFDACAVCGVAISWPRRRTCSDACAAERYRQKAHAWIRDHPERAAQRRRDYWIQSKAAILKSLKNS